MKNLIKFGIIAFVAIMGFSLVSCGGIDSSLDGTWKAEVNSVTYTMKIAKDNFEITTSIDNDSIKDALAALKGDKVSTSGNKITVKKGSADIGTVEYSISNKEMTLSNPSTAFYYITNISKTWTK